MRPASAMRNESATYMADKWKDKGECNDLFDMAVDLITFDHNPFEKNHLVENKETGEQKEIFVGPDQTVGEAIEKGQWKKN